MEHIFRMVSENMTSTKRKERRSNIWDFFIQQTKKLRRLIQFILGSNPGGFQKKVILIEDINGKNEIRIQAN